MCCHFKRSMLNIRLTDQSLIYLMVLDFRVPELELSLWNYDGGGNMKSDMLSVI